MEKRHAVLERLARGQCVVLDGSTASELERRGYRPGAPMFDAAAAREVPELVTATHRGFVDAGADVITAFTARTTVRTLARGGLGMRAAALTHRAVDLALEVANTAGRPVAVAGVLAALEDAVQAERTPSSRTLADEHREQAARIQSTGCDLILVERMPTLRESLAATAAARAVMPHVWTVLGLRDRTHLVDGTSLESAAINLVAVGSQAVLVESTNGADVIAAVAALGALALGVPLGARWTSDPTASTATVPDRLVTELLPAMQRGARILGGGRGVGPEHIRALAGRVRSRAAA